MNEYEQKVLTDIKVYCPKEIVAKYKHKHTKEKDWTRFYYYKEKKCKVVVTESLEIWIDGTGLDADSKVLPTIATPVFAFGCGVYEFKDTRGHSRARAEIQGKQRLPGT